MAKKLSKEEVQKRQEARRHYEISQGGDFATYFGMLGNSLVAPFYCMMGYLIHSAIDQT